MKTQTVVLQIKDELYGGYDYVEYSIEEEKFSVGNSLSHMGHGDVKLNLRLNTKQELEKQVKQLKLKDFKEIKTFYKK